MSATLSPFDEEADEVEVGVGVDAAREGAAAKELAGAELAISAARRRMSAVDSPCVLALFA